MTGPRADVQESFLHPYIKPDWDGGATCPICGRRFANKVWLLQSWECICGIVFTVQKEGKTA